MDNYFIMTIKAISENESFARSTVAGFALPLNPTIEQITDIKTAVSEGITNSIVHGYQSSQQGEIILKCRITNQTLEIIIIDNGIGIDNIDEALTPFFTTKPEEERSGMGFTLMQSFMDELRVESKPGCGTTIYMTKTINLSED